MPNKKTGLNFINVQVLAQVYIPRQWWLDCLLALLGSAHVKAVSKHFGEIDPRCQFHQRFSHMFFVRILGAKLRFSLAPKICTKNAREKRWWNWLLVSVIVMKGTIFLLKHSSANKGQVDKLIIYLLRT